MWERHYWQCIPYLNIRRKSCIFIKTKVETWLGFSVELCPRAFAHLKVPLICARTCITVGLQLRWLTLGKNGHYIVKFRLWVQIVQESCSICSFDMPTVIFTLTMNWLWLLPVPLYNSTWMETTKMVWMEFVLHHRGYLQFNKHLS